MSKVRSKSSKTLSNLYFSTPISQYHCSDSIDNAIFKYEEGVGAGVFDAGGGPGRRGKRAITQREEVSRILNLPVSSFSVYPCGEYEDLAVEINDLSK